MRAITLTLLLTLAACRGTPEPGELPDGGDDGADFDPLVDYDGDGLCRDGADRDGDGRCDGDGELAEHGVCDTPDHGPVLVGAPGVCDCDEGDPAIYLAAEEACDGRDNNCDGCLDNDGRCDGALSSPLSRECCDPGQAMTWVAYCIAGEWTEGPAEGECGPCL